MIVCVCKAIRARTIEERIAAGDRTLEDLAKSLGAATDCGTCASMILGMIEEALTHPGNSTRGGAA